MEFFIVKVGNKYIEDKWDGTCRLVDDIKYATKYRDYKSAKDSILYEVEENKKYLKQKKYILKLEATIVEESLLTLE